MISKNIFVSLVLGIGLCVAGYAWVMKKGTPVATDDTLVVGISADFPPFTFIKENTFVGFDIDLVEAVGAHLGKKIVYKNMPFGTLLPSLQLGTIQVIAAGLTATEERAKHVLFTTPYLEGEPLVLVSLQESPIKTIEDLQSKVVVVNEGYTADTYISGVSGLDVLRLKSPAEAFLALKSGRAAAFVTAQNTIKPFFDQYSSEQVMVVAIPDTSENASLAISPKHAAILPHIQAALDALRQDGSIQKMRTKWGL